MDNRRKLLSVSDLHVKFKVRGRTLTAIRGISLDFYENESVAIVGESGSGKSVFTKTFAGMLDQNGYISQGRIVFNDPMLEDVTVALSNAAKSKIASINAQLNVLSKAEAGAEIYSAIKKLEAERIAKGALSDEEAERFNKKLGDLKFKRTEAFNKRLTVDKSKQKAEYKNLTLSIADYDKQLSAVEAEKKALIAKHKAELSNNSAYHAEFNSKMAALKQDYAKAINGSVSEEIKARNAIIAKEIYLTLGVEKVKKSALIKAFEEAMRIGLDVADDDTRTAVFETVCRRVKFVSENETTLMGKLILNLAMIKNPKEWTRIRGGRIATVFQDPMTSLNPIITIGKQITSVIMKHQECNATEARARALELMRKVGIPNAEKRFDDYPFQYSGGMRQRIVIAIALSCQPKILICDEPTTALDVTIQAQILELLKELQKEFKYTIVFITHDLGVVANVADRVAVLYAGQVVEMGTAEEVFYDPRHPYTWALLSSLPQLAQRNTKLYSISGTPPSLYNSIVGDAFAPRNPYCLKIDTLKEPPMFKVTDTHYAKTWLLDPRAPETKKPEIIENIHEKLMNAFNI